MSRVERYTSPSSRELRVLSVLCLGAFLFFNSYGSINVALPSIQRAFGSSLTAVQWVSTIGLVMTSSLSLCLGRAGDFLGRTRLYKLGVVLYALGSGVGAAAQNLPQLVAARVVMTVGLAMAIPMAPAILALGSTAARRGWMLGLLLGATALGRASGPMLGGLLLYLWDWRGVFLLTCLIGMAASAAALRTFRQHEKTGRGAFDVGGAVSLMIAYPSLLLGLSAGARSNWDPAATFGWFGLAAAGLAGFLVAELRARHPLVPLILLRSFPLMAGLCCWRPYSPEARVESPGSRAQGLAAFYVDRVYRHGFHGFGAPSRGLAGGVFSASREGFSEALTLDFRLGGLPFFDSGRLTLGLWSRDPGLFDSSGLS